MIELSVIIPCKNEEQYISLCLDALLKQAHYFEELEIVLVDNGSTDRTLDIVKKYGPPIKLLRLPHRTISDVRNHGAMNSKGEWLAFVDADVEVDDNWGASLVQAINRFEKAQIEFPNIITGSTYSIPHRSCWIERVWVHSLNSRDKSSDRYINGGNLIVHRQLFNKVGGFDPAYKTGEDEKLCFDARNCGGKVIKQNSIKAIHHGYPKSIKQFFRRERWHGLGMVNYFSHPWRSKELSLAFYYLFIVACFLLSTILTKNVFMSGAIGILCLILPLFALSVSRCIAARPIYILPLTLLYFIYGFARTFSLFDISFGYIKNSKL